MDLRVAPCCPCQSGWSQAQSVGLLLCSCAMMYCAKSSIMDWTTGGALESNLPGSAQCHRHCIPLCIPSNITLGGTCFSFSRPLPRFFSRLHAGHFDISEVMRNFQGFQGSSELEKETKLIQGRMSRRRPVLHHVATSRAVASCSLTPCNHEIQYLLVSWAQRCLRTRSSPTCPLYLDHAKCPPASSDYIMSSSNEPSTDFGHDRENVRWNA